MIGKRFMVLLAVFASLPLASCAATNSAHVPASRLVGIDGRAMRIVSAGLADRRPNQPVIIFESGAGTPLETWDPILPGVASFSPLIAYDRSGTGQSAWDEEPPTPERTVAKLRQLLAQLGVAPPYILVGHSWGGALVRYHAGLHPDEVAAVLYIDPTDITQAPEDEVRIFESIGAGGAARDEFYAMMERS